MCEGVQRSPRLPCSHKRQGLGHHDSLQTPRLLGTELGSNVSTCHSGSMSVWALHDTEPAGRKLVLCGPGGGPKGHCLLLSSEL